MISAQEHQPIVKIIESKNLGPMIYGAVKNLVQEALVVYPSHKNSQKGDSSERNRKTAALIMQLDSLQILGLMGVRDSGPNMLVELLKEKRKPLLQYLSIISLLETESRIPEELHRVVTLLGAVREGILSNQPEIYINGSPEPSALNVLAGQIIDAMSRLQYVIESHQLYRLADIQQGFIEKKKLIEKLLQMSDLSDSELHTLRKYLREYLHVLYVLEENLPHELSPETLRYVITLTPKFKEMSSLLEQLREDASFELRTTGVTSSRYILTDDTKEQIRNLLVSFMGPEIS